MSTFSQINQYINYSPGGEKKKNKNKATQNCATLLQGERLMMSKISASRSLLEEGRGSLLYKAFFSILQYKTFHHIYVHICLSLYQAAQISSWFNSQKYEPLGLEVLSMLLKLASSLAEWSFPFPEILHQ